MSGLSIQDITSLFETYESRNEARHRELRDDLHKFIDKTDTRVKRLEKAEDKREAFRSYLKPIFISLVTAAIVGGVGLYVS